MPHVIVGTLSDGSTITGGAGTGGVGEGSLHQWSADAALRYSLHAAHGRAGAFEDNP